MSSPRTPTRPKRQEHDTPRRARFYNAYFKKKKQTSLALIYRQKDIQIPPSTARYWLRQRAELGSPSVRRTRQSSTKPGRPRKLSVNQLEPLLSPSHPSHGLYYDQIIEQEGLDVAPFTLRRNLSTCLNARRYKMPRSTTIST
jgi:hypothetical protein